MTSHIPYYLDQFGLALAGYRSRYEVRSSPRPTKLMEIGMLIELWVNRTLCPGELLEFGLTMFGMNRLVPLEVIKVMSGSDLRKYVAL